MRIRSSAAVEFGLNLVYGVLRVLYSMVDVSFNSIWWSIIAVVLSTHILLDLSVQDFG